MTGNDPESLRALAQQCRSLARGVSTPGAARSLQEMASTYEKRAEAAAARDTDDKPTMPPPVAEQAD